ncbi:MAG: RluA family pseudouridine synthase [Deltaproteobacteria bacterium]|jgi:23S rRNA pseudouridine1911/1915/1917 synthase|nr:RluA family pseudouridine synthase [Deltaproteobacteria bacterium]
MEPPSPAGKTLTLLADRSHAGKRLDAALSGLFPGYSRSALARAVKSGLVLVDGLPARPSTRVRAGQRIDFTPPGTPGAAPLPAPGIPLRILHEDASIIVVDKQPGLAVHPGAGTPGPTLAGAVLALHPELSSVGDPARPGIVHRLDKDTSGIIVMARTREALESLREAFAGRLARKRYLAFAKGLPPLTGRIDSPVSRHPARRHRMAAGLPGGRQALTTWRVLRSFPATGVSLLSMQLHTGRTHQARVHLASAGFPVLGDPLYGPGQKAFLKAFPSLAALVGRQLLHARRLSIPHPAGGRASYAAPWPEDFVAVCRELARLETA